MSEPVRITAKAIDDLRKRQDSLADELVNFNRDYIASMDRAIERMGGDEMRALHQHLRSFHQDDIEKYRERRGRYFANSIIINTWDACIEHGEEFASQWVNYILEACHRVKRGVQVDDTVANFDTRMEPFLQKLFAKSTRELARIDPMFGLNAPVVPWREAEQLAQFSRRDASKAGAASVIGIAAGSLAGRASAEVIIPDSSVTMKRVLTIPGAIGGYSVSNMLDKELHLFGKDISLNDLEYLVQSISAAGDRMASRDKAKHLRRMRSACENLTDYVGDLGEFMAHATVDWPKNATLDGAPATHWHVLKNSIDQFFATYDMTFGRGMNSHEEVVAAIRHLIPMLQQVESLFPAAHEEIAEHAHEGAAHLLQAAENELQRMQKHMAAIDSGRGQQK